MTTQIISLEALQKVRQHIKTMLTLPESENRPRLAAFNDAGVPNSLADLGDLFRVGASLEDGVPMPNDQGKWFLSVMEPSMAIAKLPHIALKPGYRLITYLYRVRESGCGCTWALPAALATTAHLELALNQASRASQAIEPPCPTGALPDFMAAVQGNNQPVSFVIASILRRELQEFGCLGAQQAWRQHRLIASAPAQARWQWRTDTAPDLNPKIRLRPDGQIIVEFFSCRVHPSVAIFQHLDQYQPGEYVAQSIDRPIAYAEHKTH